MKKTTQISILVILALVIGLYFFYDVKYVSPKKYVTRHETLASEYINGNIEDLKVLFFSDLEYGEFVDNERLTSLVKIINDNNPDVVLFGGDLVGEKVILNETQKNELLTELKKIKAPLGKFAVLGDNDASLENIKSDVESILLNSDFEVLHNTHKTIRNNSSDAINIIGLDNIINGDKNYENAFSNISSSSYTLVFAHTPDTALQIDELKTNYFISGHSHGGQINFLFYSYYTPEGSSEFSKGKKNINDNYIVDVSNGVGTTKKDFRIASSAEVVLFTFAHKDPPPAEIDITELENKND